MKRLLILAALALAGCTPDKETKDMDAVAVNDAGRFSVRRVQIIRDDLAYSYRRGVYVITDNQTGQEYVGVSGVGISELGSHSSGKTSQGDER